MSDLRELLESWTVPPPPPGVEERVRRMFHRRRRATHTKVWLSVAAALALAALAADSWPRRPAARPITVPSRAGLAPRAPETRPALPPGPPPAVGRRSVSVPRTAPRQASAESAVLVEPGQAEMLVQLARGWRGVRQAPPAVSMPPIEVRAADRWESAGDEWSAWQRPSRD